MRWWMGVVAAALLPVAGFAQDQADDPSDDPGAEPEAVDLLSEDELDDLVAPVALYPDALLAQLFVAATYPLDVMKADRFLDENSDIPDAERADLANEEDWDQSVTVLAGGFPDVLARMADQIDWTEELGDAMLAQTDDLLDAVQRMRAQAEATGNLGSNDAQTVEVEGDSISIAPADPEVVYVPSYDPQTVYTTPVTQAPVVYQDPGVSFGDVVTTGAIAFGSAMLINEIFDDDDWDDDYWHGPRSIDWDDDSIYPGRVNVDGDVNVKVNKNKNNVKVDRNDNRKNDVRIGDRDGDKKQRDAKWEPDRERSDDAKKNLEKRNDDRRSDSAAADRQRKERAEAWDGSRKDRADGDNGANRPGNGDNGRPGGGDNGRPGSGDNVGLGNGDNARPGGGDSARPGGGGRDDSRTKAEAKLKARGDGGGATKSVADRKPGGGSADRPKPKMDSALKPSSSGSKGVSHSKERAASSLKKDSSPAAVKARAPQVSKPKQVAKPKTASPQIRKPPPKKPAPKTSAFKKPSVSASRSHASSSRGKSSGAKLKRKH